MTPAAPLFLLDGHPVPFKPGETLIEAATRAGRHIPHLCWHPGFAPHGSCRLCMVAIGERQLAACSTAAEAGLEVRLHGEALAAQRRTLLQLLFVEGNHFCPSCERSGACKLQAEACEAGVEGPHFEQLYPDRPVDASHPDVLLDLNRCILCGLCVRASAQHDGKAVFALGGRGLGTQLVVGSASGRLGDTDLAASDLAARICPVGAILPKRRGFAVPIGQRRYDAAPISALPETDDGMPPP
ncbi:2Fe-2S iron-sulfur cluster-binding protein [Aquabacterium sp. OR-4]|uniref:2Fe-2S iron-sulfur cluster-binding protein n=1 Tax=Aquabacterium sp. OR-4 TaxID=2978127 RepID=UPI0021B1EADD|nr:2Fe-2S iron-sulfur cluster-binding protein [Aquabacterium sp. OR-4]MDT7834376.1 2Fe-2S iron-sulfur cluster-binding protein [Aquabacterium sp. OR-4]